MPISPNVQAHMMQGHQPQEASTAEQIFAKSFSDQAFTALKAKYPSLVSAVVTFKTLSVNVEKGDALGAFVVVSGDLVRYIPVTMSSGTMGSCCEMMYDKEADLFSPLSEDSVKRLIAATSVSDPQVLRKKTRVEDTRPLFRNMVRPPASSNVIMASARDGVSALPNSAKQLVAEHLMANPLLLAKIAAFYPVEHLAGKLAKTAEQPAVAQDIPEVVKIADLTRETAQKLSAEHKQEVLARGYAVIDGPADGISSLVLGMDSPREGIGRSLGVEEWNAPGTIYENSGGMEVSSRGTAGLPVKKADVLVFSGSGFAMKPAILADGVYYAGCGPAHSSCLAARITQEVSEEDLRTIASCISIDELASTIAANPSKCLGRRVRVFVPMRQGSWAVAEGFNLSYAEQDSGITHADGVWTVQTDGCCTCTVTDAIQHGYLKHGRHVIFPEGALFHMVDYDEPPTGLVPSMSVLVDSVIAMGRPLKVLRDGVDLRIKDLRAEKTASFASEADAAAYLQSEYGLKAVQIADVLSQRDSVLYKAAFDYGSLDLMQSPGYLEQPAPRLMDPMAEAPAFNPARLEDFAELEDPELMDTGILSTFADDPDIHSLLVDYTQDFLEQQDKLARIILIFSMNKRELEDSYGVDKLSGILSSCRKIFKFLGEFVANIRQYTSMAAV